MQLFPSRAPLAGAQIIRFPLLAGRAVPSSRASCWPFGGLRPPPARPAGDIPLQAARVLAVTARHWFRDGAD